MKCQNRFSGKSKKNISICCLLKILPRVLSINIDGDSQNSHNTGNDTLCLCVIKLVNRILCKKYVLKLF